MIISHRHRCIFFAVPKTATHAVRKAMAAHLGADDWQQQQLSGKQVLPIPQLARIGHGHISLRQLKPFLDPQMLQDYFKFAIVRNPFDRFVSCCAFLNRGHPAFSRNPRAWMKRALQRPQFRARVLAQPQIELLCDESGQIGMDYTGRYESLNASIRDVFGQLQLPAPELERVNPSAHKPYAEYYDDELKEAVAEFYAEDLNVFNYSFGQQS